MSKIPVTVLTGFLGSGKTTLLNRILTESHGKRIAVIENEFGEIGIDQALVINADEEVFEMNNGCICCTVRGDLIRILGNLMKRRSKFDHVIVETTGMADPGPVAQTFFVDDDVRSMFTLDGIVTLVDAKHVSMHVDDSDECREQIAFADVLVLNKIDLVGDEELTTLEERIRSMNGVAKVIRAQDARVDIDQVIDVGGFDLDRVLAEKPSFLEPEYPFEWVGLYELAEGRYEVALRPGPDPAIKLFATFVEHDGSPASKETADVALRAWSRGRKASPGEVCLVAGSGEAGVLETPESGESVFSLEAPRGGTVALFTEHLPSEFALELRMGGSVVLPRAEHEFAAGHSHDEDVTSVGVHMEEPLDGERVNAWLSELLRERGNDIFRSKGILNLASNDNRFVFQGVHMLLDGREDRPWGADETRASDVVFIGRNLDRRALLEGLEACRA